MVKTASLALLGALSGVVLLLGPAHSIQAALIEDGKGSQLLIGRDDDNIDNAVVQASAAANQSLNRTDIIEGGQGNDVMFGLNGDDVMDGGQGVDIILGGPDGGAAPGGPPNSDIMFGGPGDDVNLWAPGDGSEVFAGGPGSTLSCSAGRIATPLPVLRVFGFRPSSSVSKGFRRAYLPRM